MPKHRSMKYREPDKRQYTKIIFTGCSLNELFSEEELRTFKDAARNRIIGEFHYATEPNPRYRAKPGGRSTHRTDNYIIGVSAKLGDLARYIAKSMHRSFINKTDLPNAFQGLHPKLIERVIQEAQFDTIILVLQEMRNREIWYEEGSGTWHICQSSMDKWSGYSNIARSLKRDDRSWHGRPARDRGRMPEGVSVSLA